MLPFLRKITAMTLTIKSVKNASKSLDDELFIKELEEI